MAGLRSLKVHLKSVKTTGQLASAMKTVSTAKYSKINGIRERYLPYANACKEMLDLCIDDAKSSPHSESETETEKKTLYVLLGGNRGLCGGYNSELFKIFESELEKADEKQEKYEIISCGKSANAYLKEKNIGTLQSFVFADVPEYENACTLADLILDKYKNKQDSEIVFVYRKFVNMLNQEPTFETLLPPKKKDENSKKSVDYEVICVPSKDVLSEKLSFECIRSAVYGLLLECAIGVQAATMMTMRTASDNASELSEILELQINRRRQNDVTASVLETSSSMYAQYNDKPTETNKQRLEK